MINLKRKMKVAVCCPIVILFASCTISENNKVTEITSYTKGTCFYSVGNLCSDIIAPCGCAQVGDSVGTLFENMYRLKEGGKND